MSRSFLMVLPKEMRSGVAPAATDTATGRAPPRPMAATKRSAASTGTSGDQADSSVPRPNSTTLRPPTIRCPQRPASGPQAR